MTITLTPEHLRQWDEEGYVLFKQFYSSNEINEINDLVNGLWRRRKSLNSQYVIDIFIGTKEERRVYFADAPRKARKFPFKLNDLYLTCDVVRNHVVGDRIAPILAKLLGGSPMVCNSLNFEFGSQQPFHFDTFYMPSPTPNKMVASWVALEDATNENGPLAYYPGSHKIEPYLFSNGTTIAINEEMPSFNDYIDEQISSLGLKAQTLEANKGDLLIWHSQLFHGGSPINNKDKTRKSLVTHYFTTEDFPETKAPMVGASGSYMARPAQPVGYPYEEKSFLQRLLP